MGNKQNESHLSKNLKKKKKKLSEMKTFWQNNLTTVLVLQVIITMAWLTDLVQPVYILVFLYVNITHSPGKTGGSGKTVNR